MCGEYGLGVGKKTGRREDYLDRTFGSCVGSAMVQAWTSVAQAGEEDVGRGACMGLVDTRVSVREVKSGFQGDSRMPEAVTWRPKLR